MSTRSVFAFVAQPLFRQCRPASVLRAARPFDLARFTAANLHPRFASTRPYTPQAIAIAKTLPSFQQSSLLWSVRVAGLAGFALGLSVWSQPQIECQALPASPVQPASYSSTGNTLPPPPESTVKLYELSFGTVCGVCAGVFVKKGAKALAFVLGGVFVLLQYFGSLSIIRIDWGRMATRFENLFYTTDAAGRKSAPTVQSLFAWMVEFLTADFQPRASFIAGLLLGLRIG